MLQLQWCTVNLLSGKQPLNCGLILLLKLSKFSSIYIFFYKHNVYKYTKPDIL